MDVYVRLSGRTAEEAYLTAKGLRHAAGFAVDIDLVTGIGPAVVSALDELGPVMVLAALLGAPGQMAAAAGRLARLGASWITVAAVAGGEAMAAAVEAVSGMGCGVAAATLPAGLEAAEVAALTGATRGRLVSRLAAAAVAAGATGVVACTADLGVIAQVAPDAVGIVDAGDAPEEWAEAERRGAGVLVLPGPHALEVFVSGERVLPARSGNRGRRR